MSGGYSIPASSWKPVGSADSRHSLWEASIPLAARIPANVTNLFVGIGDAYAARVPSRRYRVRTSQLRWVGALSRNKSDPLAAHGFIYNASDIPASWDVSPAALKSWRVFAYHSWDSSFHTVR